MKVTAKSNPLPSETAPQAIDEIGSAPESTPGGKQANKDSPIAETPALKSPMVIPCMDLQRFQKRLVANGFSIPRIVLPIRRLWFVVREAGLSFQSATPMDPDTHAVQWIRAFQTRETGSGGVDAIKARIRFDAETIRGWLQKTN